MITRLLLACILMVVAASVGYSADSTVGGTVSSLLLVLRAPIISIVLGVLVIYIMISIMRMRYAHAMTGGIALLCIFFGILYTQGSASGTPGFYSSDAANGRVGEAAQASVAWEVYGSNPASPLYQVEQSPSYAIVKGFALHASLISYRLWMWGWHNGLVPLVVLGSIVWGTYLSMAKREWMPVVMATLIALIYGIFALWPNVEIQNDAGTLPLLTVYNQISGADPASTTNPRIPEIEAWAFSGGNEIAESIGMAITTQDQGANNIILQAALHAKMPDDAFQYYLPYSENCFTSARNLLAINPNTLTPNGQALRTDVQQNRGANWINEYNYNHHALSKASDALFFNVDYNSYIFNSVTDVPSEGSAEQRNAYWKLISDRLQGTEVVTKLPAEREENARPDRISGRTKKFDSILVKSVVDSENTQHSLLDYSGAIDLENWMTLDRSIQSPIYDEITAREVSFFEAIAGADIGYSPKILRPFCSCNYTTDYAQGVSAAGITFLLDHPFTGGVPGGTISDYPPTMTDTINFTTDPGLLGHLQPLNAGDYVRYFIAKPFMSDADGTQQSTCMEAARDKENKNLWGCLVAGYYNNLGADDQNTYAPAYAAQLLFDGSFRAVLAGQSARNPGSLTQFSDRGPAANWNGYTGNFTGVGATFWQDMRTFSDMYMLAPGVQVQIGLYRGTKTPSTTAQDQDWSWSRFVSGLESMGGTAATGIMGVFGFIAGLMAKLASHLWPYVLGMAEWLLILSFMLYALASIIPGRHFVIAEWIKAVLWVSLWPLFIMFGMALITGAGSFGMASFFLQTEADDFGLSMMKMFGAILVIGAPSFTAMFITLGFGVLAQGINSVSGATFKVAGMGIALGAMAVTVGLEFLAGRIGSLGSKFVESVNSLGRLDGPRGGGTGGGKGGDDNPPDGGGGGGRRIAYAGTPGERLDADTRLNPSTTANVTSTEQGPTEVGGTRSPGPARPLSPGPGMTSQRIIGSTAALVTTTAASVLETVGTEGASAGSGMRSGQALAAASESVVNLRTMAKRNPSRTDAGSPNIEPRNPGRIE